MAIDQNAVELQKQLQRAGYNYVAQSGNSNDALTRKAIEAMNTSRNYGAGVGASALTQQGMDYLKQYATPTTPLKEAITQPVQKVTQPQVNSPNYQSGYTQATDNSGLINGQYDSLVTALKAQLQQSINNKKLDIANVPQEYQPMKNENDVNRANNLRSVLESNYNNGDRGDVGRNLALDVNTNRDNVLNSLNQSQNNDVNALKNDIASLVSEGNVQQATLQADKLKQLISNNQYMDTQNAQNSQNAFSNNVSLANLLGNYQGTDTLAQKQYDQSVTQDQFNNGVTLGNLTGNYNGTRTLQGQSFDQGVTESNRNFNYQVQQDALNHTFQEEQARIDNAYKNSSLSLEGARVALAQAQDKRDASMATLDRQYKQVQIDNAKTPTAKVTDYKTSADYKSDYAYTVTDATEAVKQLTSNANAFISKYGVDGYNALLKSARGY